MQIELDIPFDQVKSPIIRKFKAYWDQKRCSRDMPSWHDIDPTDLREVLPHMFVVSIEHDPFRVFYRLVGTIAVSFRHELTGRYLDEVESFTETVKAELADEYRLVCHRRAPTFSRDVLSTRFDNTATFYGSIFPLSSDGVTVDRCIAVEDYEGQNPDDIAASDSALGYGRRRS